ncbi:hypothetical protein PSQ40_12975 [Curvibacter sp. HBC61]|uniref:HTH marR-type domain-containing protein n=1 Tax=Curvibacter cyanobacteriorum TaxID=3026422 RepID=A0ABT5MZI9_9BURK|nr:hypothetical protein [Curvibacter sp. HBC61]MDD0839490.1 hypothetical protein [Curvibacter sp. HBC61]
MPDFSLLDFDLPDLNLPPLSDQPPAPQAGAGSYLHRATRAPQSEFFDPAPAGPQAPWAPRLARQAAVLEAWRRLCQGPAAGLPQRMGLFLTLAEQDVPRLSRAQIAQLWPDQPHEALDRALHRLLVSGLLAWEGGQRRYLITPLARQLARLLQPWGQAPTSAA